MPANLENSAVATGLEKVSFHSNPKERKCQRMLKLPHNCTHLISHASKVINWFSKPGFNSIWIMNFQMFKMDLEKGRGAKDQIANIQWIIEKAREFQKNIYFCFIDYVKAFDCVVTTNCGKFWKRWEYQTTLPVLWETCMQVKKQQLEPYMKQWTDSKLGKE